MNVHAKQRIHYGAMAIAITVTQLLAYATPVNANELDYLSSEDLQTVTISETTPQMEVNFDDYQSVYITFPIDGGYDRLASGFGVRPQACSACSTNHQGADFAMAQGSPIRAVFNGIVVKSKWEPGFGEVIEIRHPDLNGIVTLYGHMKGGSRRVHVGDTVVAGQVIGQVGHTGTATVNHLHLGIYIDGYAIDPVTWLKSHHARRFEKPNG